MATIKMPQTGKAVESGTVLRWLVKAGASVSNGDLLVEMETEEGLLQVEAPLAGTVREILVGEGKTAAVHGPLMVIDDIAGAAAMNEAVKGDTEGLKAVQAAGADSGPAGKVIPVLMPKAGQSMEEGTLVSWRVKVGDTIKKGDVIFEIETDKATMEVEATDEGRLARIVVPEGSVLAVLQPVAYLAENDADVEAFVAAERQTGRRGEEEKRSNGNGPAKAGIPNTTPGNASTVASSVSVMDGGRVKSSPAARKVAGQRGVDLHGVAGSGPGGRVLSTDVPMQATATGPTRRRMSQMRKAIARNLLQSKQTIPHFYMRLTVNAEPMVAFYQAQKAQYPCSINDVIVAACARTIREFPAFRSRIEGEEIVESPTANIGIAVGMDDGLVVPVLIAAERMSLRTIGAESKRIANAARGGKIEGMGHGCFTITNLGMFGTEEFAAIINPPEAAILAVGATREAVIVKDGAMRAGKVMTMTLSADHRVVDGMLAAKFMARLKELLESPEQLA